MWVLVIRIQGIEGEGFIITQTRNTYWLQEIIAKLLDCDNIYEVRAYKEEE